MQKEFYSIAVQKFKPPVVARHALPLADSYFTSSISAVGWNENNYEKN